MLNIFDHSRKERVPVLVSTGDIDVAEMTTEFPTVPVMEMAGTPELLIRFALITVVS